MYAVEIRAFVAAHDFALSLRFRTDLRFAIAWQSPAA